ncbi:MAG: FAD-dependent oxidoreductase [Deltaproteobacteria bacterium]|nr:FAD-dependent oxidoreductase [Deltaproteobacteria bacterium]
MSENVVIIGGVAAGMSAASQAKKRKPGMNVIALEKTNFVSYGSCGLPYYIMDLIKKDTDLVAISKEKFKTEREIDVFTKIEVVNIDTKAGIVHATDHNDKKDLSFPYDYIAITTGASPVKPQIPGIDNPGIFQLRTLEDGIAIKGYIKSRPVKRVAIIGAGYIGMEMAEVLRALNMEVIIIEKLPNILGTMDDEINTVVEKTLDANGIKLMKSTEVRLFEKKDNGGIKIETTNGNFDVDLVILSIGINPNSKLAKVAGIVTGAHDAILVNERMETNVPHIYSAGDCATAKHIILKKDVYIPLGTTANKQGKIAGANISGANETFKGIVGTSVVKVFDLEVARTGLTEKDAKENGFNAVTNLITSRTRAHYYPGSKPITIKLVVEKKKGKLLGAEMVGGEGVSKRIDIVAAGLYAGMTADELSRLDLSYAPPFSPVWDPLLVAASDILKKV